MVLLPVVVNVSLQLPLPVIPLRPPEQTSPVLAVIVTAPIGLYELTLNAIVADAIPDAFKVTVVLDDVIVVVVVACDTCSITVAVAVG